MNEMFDIYAQGNEMSSVSKYKYITFEKFAFQFNLQKWDFKLQHNKLRS